jgi:hypothetical protein
LVTVVANAVVIYYVRLPLALSIVDNIVVVVAAASDVVVVVVVMRQMTPQGFPLIVSVGGQL